MFESDGGAGVSADGGHAAALARLRTILPARPAGAVRLGEGPIERARRVAPGVYQAPGRSSGWAPGSSDVPGGQAGPGQADGPRPGPELARTLNAADPAVLSSFDLLEAAAGWERLIGWAQARQGEVIAEFARRRPGPDAPDEPGRRVSEFAADEVAARLRIGRRAAELKLGIALDLADRLPATGLALREGRIDLAKARAVAEHTANLTDPAGRRAVEERVLRRAGSQTASELRRSLLRAVAAVDCAAVVTRHARARAGRFLDLHPLPDGMAEITARLPADDATMVFTAVDTLARCAHPQDPRGIQARRADAMVDLCRAVLTPADPDPGHHDPTDAADHGAGSATRSSRPRRRTRGHRRRRGSGPHIRVTVTASTLLGLDEQPGELTGYGPIPAAMARRIAADPDATWRRLLTDPASGVLLDYGTTVYRPPPHLRDHVVARDQVCAFPGCRQPAERCDLDHREPFPHGPTCAANLGPLCRHHHRAKTEAGWTWQRAPDGTITWTAPTGHQYDAPTPPVLESGDCLDEEPDPELPPF